MSPNLGYNLDFAKTKLALDLDETNVIAELLPNKVEVSVTGLKILIAILLKSNYNEFREKFRI